LSAASILSLLLAFCMALSPAVVPDGVQAVTFTPLMVTFQSSDGQMTAGLNKTEAGQPVISYHAGDFGIDITSDRSYLTNESGTHAVSFEELYPLLAGSMPFLFPSEADEDALRLFAASLLMGLPSKGFTLTPMSTGFSISFDLDELARHLHMLVPSVLTTHAATFDPVLAKYAPALLGEAVTCAQLAEWWPTLGLDQINTGVSFTLTMLEKKDGFVLIGRVGDTNFLADVTEQNLSLEITTADGRTFAFDSVDTVYAASLIDKVLNEHITEKAFSIQQTVEPQQEFYKLVTTTIKLNTTALAADLNHGLAAVIQQNAEAVDQLLDKYRCWIALADEALASQLTAEWLINAFMEEQLISLPEETGELVIISDQYNGTDSINGHFGSILLDGSATSGSFGLQESGTLSLVLTIGDHYLPQVYQFDCSFDAKRFRMALSSNTLLFDAFHSITFSLTDAYDFYWNLTTDTNVLRAGYSDVEQYLEFKIGPVNASLYMDENDFTHATFYAPELFAALHTDGSSIDFDSTFGGFNLSERSYDSWDFHGYLVDDSDDRSTFGLTYDEWPERLDAYLNTSESEHYSFSYTLDTIVIQAENDLITLHLLENAGDAATLISVLVNGERQATVAMTDKGQQFLIEVYQGDDTSAAPACTLTLDAAPAPFSPPANSTEVDGKTFLQLWEDRF